MISSICETDISLPSTSQTWSSPIHETNQRNIFLPILHHSSLNTHQSTPILPIRLGIFYEPLLVERCSLRRRGNFARHVPFGKSSRSIGTLGHGVQVRHAPRVWCIGFAYSLRPPFARGGTSCGVIQERYNTRNHRGMHCHFSCVSCARHFVDHSHDWIGAIPRSRGDIGDGTWYIFHGTNCGSSIGNNVVVLAFLVW